MPEELENLKPEPDIEAEVKIFDYQDFAKERSNVQPVETKKEDIKSEAELDDEIELGDEKQSEIDASLKRVKESEKKNIKGLPVDGIDDEMERMEVPKIKEEVKEKKELPASRDYSIFTPEEADIFKKTSNQAFEKIKSLYTENKELKNKPPVEIKQGELPPNYFSHPKAYLLDPNYEKVSSEASLAKSIADHWKQQKLNIQYDGKWQDLTKDKDGNFVVGPLQDADKASELLVLQQMELMGEQAQEYQTKFKKFIGDFDSKVKGDNEFIKNVELKFFPGYEKPDHPTSKYQQDIINALPASQRDLPVTKLLAKTGAALNLLNAEYQKVKAELDKIKGIKQDSKEAPPTKKNFVNGSSNGHQTVTMDDFRKERASRF